MRELILSRNPDIAVSLSSEVDPAFREYERTAVTAFDAYIKPVVARYLAEIDASLAERSITAPLQVMQSRGGLANATTARERPVRLFLSGPAAGVIGGQREGALVGAEELITVDVGGTSCDIALISSSKPLTRAEGIIDRFPVRVPMVDVNAIGAGGGSIAWIDDAGGLRVGPHSAGSDPGPACYGSGGEEATVTDASVVLGYLNPEYFAGGNLRLEPDRARDIVRRRVAEPLGLSIEAAAAGIHRVLNAQMAEGIRLVSIGRGFDPRGFTLMLLGGAGPLHGCALAEELSVSRVLVPRHPGVLSASGLLSAPIEHEAAAAFAVPLEGLAMEPVLEVLGLLDARCTELMCAEGHLAEFVEAAYFADVCYVGQGYHLEIPLEVGGDDPIGDLYRAFLETHDRVYGHSVEGPARVVNLRAVHTVQQAGVLGEAAPTEATAAMGSAPSPCTERPVFLPDASAATQVPIYQREALGAGAQIPGPAIVEQSDTTTLITEGWTASAHPSGVLILTR